VKRGPLSTRLLAQALLPVCLAAASGHGYAQAYPSKPIRLIVPFAPGGNADILARVVGQKLGETLRQQVLIDNRAGANGIIGSDVAAKSPADGYTLLFVASGHAINPALYSKVPFDAVRDFAPIGRVSTTPMVLAVTNALPAKTVKEMVALARARPGVMSYASQGNGSPGHLSGVLLNTLAGIKVVHVPYKSTAQALIDLSSGEVQVMYPSLTSVLPHVKAGKLRALAITSSRRSQLAPALVTMDEAGIKGYEAGIWNGILAPAGTPESIVSMLNTALVGLLQARDVQDRIAGLGADVQSSTPAAFAAFIADEIRKWGKLVRDSGARLD